MTLTNYQPWTLLDRFNQQLNQFSYSDQTIANNDADYVNGASRYWHPAVDIKEEAGRFFISADLPGVVPEDIEITAEKGTLTIKGIRKSELQDDNKTYERVERAMGGFYRCFRLPDTADADRIEAKGNNGVLEIVIPKHEKIKPRKIKVKS